jgi:hypothetical protein
VLADLALALALIAGPLQPLERVELRLPIDSGQALLLFALGLYAVTALAMHTPDERLPPMRPLQLMLAGFLAICLASYFVARDLRDWFFECLKLGQMLVVCSLVAGMRGRRRALLFVALALSACGEALYGVLQNRVCWTWPSVPSWLAMLCGPVPPEFKIVGGVLFRGYGTFEQPNPFGGYLGMLWPVFAGVALYCARQRRWFVAALAMCVVVLCIAGLQASGSRGALVGAGCAAAAMALACIKRPAVWVTAAAVLALLLFAFGVVDVPAPLERQLAEFGDVDVRDVYLTPINFSTVERLAHWQAALRMAESSPWLGVGYGNYAAAYDEFRLLVWSNALGHAHNYYLNLPAETGILGLVAYLLWWGAAFVTAWRAARGGGADAWLAVGLIGTFAHISGHHVFDNLYVANMHITIGALLGIVLGIEARRARQ